MTYRHQKIEGLQSGLTFRGSLILLGWVWNDECSTWSQRWFLYWVDLRFCLPHIPSSPTPRASHLRVPSSLLFHSSTIVCFPSFLLFYKNMNNLFTLISLCFSQSSGNNIRHCYHKAWRRFLLVRALTVKYVIVRGF